MNLQIGDLILTKECIGLVANIGTFKVWCFWLFQSDVPKIAREQTDLHFSLDIDKLPRQIKEGLVEYYPVKNDE